MVPEIIGRGIFKICAPLESCTLSSFQFFFRCLKTKSFLSKSVFSQFRLQALVNVG